MVLAGILPPFFDWVERSFQQPDQAQPRVPYIDLVRPNKLDLQRAYISCVSRTFIDAAPDDKRNVRQQQLYERLGECPGRC